MGPMELSDAPAAAPPPAAAAAAAAGPRHATLADCCCPSLRGENAATLRLLTVCASISGALFGYDTGVVSGAIQLIKQDFRGPQNEEMSTALMELIVSITVGFAALFTPVSAFLNIRFGRRRVIMVASMLYALGSVVVASAPTPEVMIVGRAVLGAAIGLTSVTVPLYVAESAPADSRGQLVTLNDFMIVAGQVIAGLTNAFLQYVDDGWRYSMGAAALPALIQLVGFLYLPESPRILLLAGRQEAARDALLAIRGGGKGGAAVGAAVDAELASMAASISAEASSTALGYKEMWAALPIRRAMLLGVGLQVLQQAVGINTVMYYGATIMTSVGFTQEQAIWLSALCNFCQLVGVSFSISECSNGRLGLVDF